MEKLQLEIQTYKNREDSLQDQISALNNEVLLLKGVIDHQNKKKKEIVASFSDRIDHLVLNLDVKEQYIQRKETKWLEIENVLFNYLKKDDKLFNKLWNLKYEAVPN